MIRLANIDDLDQIIKLLHEVLDVHYELRPDLFKFGTTKYTKEELCQLLMNKKILIFVYCEKEAILGHLFCFDKDNRQSNNLKDIKTLYIDDLCIKKEYRNKGIGTQLFQYVKEYALANHYYNITLNVNVKNINAVKFYEKMGLNAQNITYELILKEDK